jgi:hypothetical protein
MAAGFSARRGFEAKGQVRAGTISRKACLFAMRQARVHSI